MTVAGVFLILAPNLFKISANTQSTLLALGTGLLASSLFSGVYVFYTNQDFVELLSEQMGNTQAVGMQKIVEYLAQTNPTYLPVAVYDPADDEMNQFNYDLNASIRSSRTYRFQGLTGSWVPIRLEATKTSLSLLRVCVSDPTDLSTLRVRATRDITLGLMKDYQSAVDDAKRKMIQCVVGLLECRARCQCIEMSLVSEPSSDRYEIFDSEIYITTFDNAAPSTKYPNSYKFNQASFLYDMIVRRFDLLFSRSSPKVITIRPEDSRELILDELRKIGLDIEASQYGKCADQFWREVDKYSDQWTV